MNDPIGSVLAGETGEIRAGVRIDDLVGLTKPRLAMLSTLTAMAGYGLAPASFEFGAFFGVTLGSFLSACGALALNQFLERRTDGLMERTRDRPLPSGRMRPVVALGFGAGLVVMGVGLLMTLATVLAGVLALVTVWTYVGLYTPLKRRSTWCTHFGALPGALPPWIGWTGAGAAIDGMAMLLFVILFAWQMPHFFAIARMCEADYARAGICVLRVRDGRMDRLRMETLVFAGILVVCIGVAFGLGMGGWLFLFGGGGIAVWQFALAVRFAGDPDRGAARRLFFATLLFLPVVLVTWLIDHGG